MLRRREGDGAGNLLPGYKAELKEMLDSKRAADIESVGVVSEYAAPKIAAILNAIPNV
ncbi:hypothetical protein FIBSPDRAFT_1038675 [Athelia psychrophila]|nr:hypothetical protein FIBSPDRAFT_1038675 [Fibularhizoctonia sp. CBS 109695]